MSLSPFAKFPGSPIHPTPTVLRTDRHPVDFWLETQTEATGAHVANSSCFSLDYDGLAGICLYGRVAQAAASGDGEIKFDPGVGSDFSPTLTIPQGTTVHFRGSTTMANVDSTGTSYGRLSLKSGQNGTNLQLVRGGMAREVLK